VMISGLIEVNPEHSNSTAGRVAQGSSDMACQDYRKSNWRSAKGLCINRPHNRF
jgi:hypothetical protein